MNKLLLFFLLVIPVSVFSQDKLFKKDGSKLEVKITEVGINTVKYKLFTNPEGPDYVLLKTDVLLIEYANGSTEVFKDSGYDAPPKEFTYQSSKEIARNIITVNMVQLLYSNFTLAYERRSQNGSLGVRFPVSIGLSENRETYEYAGSLSINKIYSIGVDFNFYPSPNKKLAYYIGPSIYYGSNRYYYYTNYPGYGTVGVKSNNYSFMINNGLMFQPVANFAFSTSLGIGMSKVDLSTSQSNYYGYQSGVLPRATIDFCLGFKF